MKKLLVTTALKNSPGIIREAKNIAEVLKIPYLPRENYSIKALTEQCNTSAILVVSTERLTMVNGEEEYFFHPSMAKIRIKDLVSGQSDQMARAMDLNPGDSVLDCTLGLGTDALVESFVTGSTGQITGLEKIPVLALITQRGLQEYVDNNDRINQAMRRIKVINADYNLFLKEAPDNSYDVVYFDPMFRRPNLKSSAINALRLLAEHEPLKEDIIRQAMRVARKRVVIKERKGSAEFARLDFKAVVGGKYSPINYGVIKVKDGEE